MRLTPKQLKYFQLARMMSQHSGYRHQIGAVIVKKSKILGMGFNKPTKTHPRSKHPFQTIHAELDALIGIDKVDLLGADIYVYRELRNGNWASAKPCESCRALLIEVGINRVYYTTKEGFNHERI